MPQFLQFWSKNLQEVVVGTNMDKIYLVMEYVEHDMKCLMEGLNSRGRSFTIGQSNNCLSIFI